MTQIRRQLTLLGKNNSTGYLIFQLRMSIEIKVFKVYCSYRNLDNEHNNIIFLKASTSTKTSKAAEHESKFSR